MWSANVIVGTDRLNFADSLIPSMMQFLQILISIWFWTITGPTKRPWSSVGWQSGLAIICILLPRVPRGLIRSSAGLQPWPRNSFGAAPIGALESWNSLLNGIWKSLISTRNPLNGLKQQTKFLRRLQDFVSELMTQDTSENISFGNRQGEVELCSFRFFKGLRKKGSYRSYL